jgi:hypothetical protein
MPSGGVHTINAASPPSPDPKWRLVTPLLGTGQQNADGAPGLAGFACWRQFTRLRSDFELEDGVAVLVCDVEEPPGRIRREEPRRPTARGDPLPCGQSPGARIDDKGHDRVVPAVRSVDEAPIGRDGNLGGAAIADEGVGQGGEDLERLEHAALLVIPEGSDGGVQPVHYIGVGHRGVHRHMARPRGLTRDDRALLGRDQLATRRIQAEGKDAVEALVRHDDEPPGLIELRLVRFGEGLALTTCLRHLAGAR